MQYTAAKSEETTGQFAKPEEYTGYEVLDPWYRRIGRVDELLVNIAGESEYLRVRTGVFGLKTFLIPARTIEVDTLRRILMLLR